MSITSDGFGIIQNNIALKPGALGMLAFGGFGIIQNNIALKLSYTYVFRWH